MSNNRRAWDYIMSSPAKYTKSFQPKSIIRRVSDHVDLPAENVPVYSSPYAGNMNFMKPKANAKNNSNNKNKQKKITVAVVQSSEPLTYAQHNKLVNKLRTVTAI